MTTKGPVADDAEMSFEKRPSGDSGEKNGEPNGKRSTQGESFDTHPY